MPCLQNGVISEKLRTDSSCESSIYELTNNLICTINPPNDRDINQSLSSELELQSLPLLIESYVGVRDIAVGTVTNVTCVHTNSRILNEYPSS